MLARNLKCSTEPACLVACQSELTCNSHFKLELVRARLFIYGRASSYFAPAQILKKKQHARSVEHDFYPSAMRENGRVLFSFETVTTKSAAIYWSRDDFQRIRWHLVKSFDGVYLKLLNHGRKSRFVALICWYSLHKCLGIYSFIHSFIRNTDITLINEWYRLVWKPHLWLGFVGRAAMCSCSFVVLGYADVDKASRGDVGDSAKTSLPDRKEKIRNYKIGA